MQINAVGCIVLPAANNEKPVYTDIDTNGGGGDVCCEVSDGASLLH